MKKKITAGGSLITWLSHELRLGRVGRLPLVLELTTVGSDSRGHLLLIILERSSSPNQHVVKRPHKTLDLVDDWKGVIVEVIFIV